MSKSSDNSQDDARLGTVLSDRYRIVERVGSGGMGVVYRGERLHLGRPVAIKFLHDLYIEEERMRARFEREAQAMGKLNHPFCVSVIDFGVEGAPYIVMDYIEGETLKQTLKNERISIPRAIRIARQVLAAADHAHGQGITHRDLKPGNINLIQDTGVGETVRIFDFGLAKLRDTGKDGDVGLSTSVVIGTPNYMSPEQSLGGKVDARTGLYAIGVVLFEMLTGSKPFQDDSAIEVIRKHQAELPPTLSEASQDRQFSSQLEDAVRKVLAKSPNDRFQSATEFAEALSATPEADTEGRGSATGYAAIRQERRLPDPPAAPLPRRMFEGSRLRRSIVAVLASIGVLTSVGGLMAIIELRSREPVSAPVEKKEQPAIEAGAKPSGPKPNASPGSPAAAEAMGKDLAQVPFASDAGESGEAVLREEVEAFADAAGQKPVTYQAVQSLMQQGRINEAIAGLRQLRRANPKNSYYVILLGNLYFQKDWWSDGLDYYQTALRMKPELYDRSVVCRNLVVALQGDKSARQAQWILLNQVGAQALPFLREAARSSANAKVKKRVSQLIAQLQRR